MYQWQVPNHHQKMEGKLLYSLACRRGRMLLPPLRCLRLHSGSLKSLPVIMDAVRRMSIHGHPWCGTTSPSWGEVMPSKLRTRLPSCVMLRMSGISGTNVGIDIRPEIGPSCVTYSSSDSDQISGRKRHSPR